MYICMHVHINTKLVTPSFLNKHFFYTYQLINEGSRVITRRKMSITLNGFQHIKKQLSVMIGKVACYNRFLINFNYLI